MCVGLRWAVGRGACVWREGPHQASRGALDSALWITEGKASDTYFSSNSPGCSVNSVCSKVTSTNHRVDAPSEMLWLRYTNILSQENFDTIMEIAS